MHISQQQKKLILFGAGIFLLALVVKMLYFLQLKASPFFLPVRNSDEEEKAKLLSEIEKLARKSGVFLAVPIVSKEVATK